MSFDQQARLEVPTAGSHPRAVKQFWQNVRNLATDAQIQDLTDRGIAIPPPEAGEKNFHPGHDGLAGDGTYKSPSFAEEYAISGPAAIEAEARRLESIEHAKERARKEQEQRERQAALIRSRGLFREYHRTKGRPVPQGRSNARTIEEIIFEYGVSRGFKPADQFNLWPADRVAVLAQLESTTYMSAWGRGL